MILKVMFKAVDNFLYNNLWFRKIGKFIYKNIFLLILNPIYIFYVRKKLLKYPVIHDTSDARAYLLEQIKHNLQNQFWSFIPAGDEHIASARIRVFSICREFERRKIRYSFQYSGETNILFVQKKADTSILQSVLDAKMRGCIIIYDVDDFGGALWGRVSPRVFAEMLRLSDIIITASIAQQEYMLKNYPLTTVKVLPNLIDYYPTDMPVYKISHNKTIKVLWFGTSGTFKHFEKYLQELLQIENLKVFVIVDINTINEFKNVYPNVEFIPWTIQTFIDDLKECDITILTHDGSIADKLKGNNKMITSIYWGIPAVVSNTPEYSRTAAELGISDVVFNNASELKLIIENLKSSESRENYLKQSQPIVWEKYSPSTIVEKLLGFITELS